MKRNKNRLDNSASFEVEIEKLVYGGDGLARHEGKVVFVPFAAPGDRIEVRPVEQKKSYIRGVITKILTPGPARGAPPCSHFGSCGGCQWQHIDYAYQTEAKRRMLEEVFHHHFPESRSLPITMKASPQPYGYRSRARLQLRGTGDHSLTGFFCHRSRTVEDVSSCPLFLQPLNDALMSMRASQCQGDLGSGIREMEIACSAAGRWICSAADSMEPAGWDQDEELLPKQVGDFVYDTHTTAFFQANEFMLAPLINTVMDRVGGMRSALDLFSGVGFFSLPLARRFQSVVAVEASPVAHRLCIRNAVQARLENIHNVCADVQDWMGAIGSVAAPEFDMVVLDPPRAGASPEVMKSLVAWAPEEILYVSCDHQTLIRDLALLPSRDYRIASVTGLDLFPQTYHFETVVSLRRR